MRANLSGRTCPSLVILSDELPARMPATRVGHVSPDMNARTSGTRAGVLLRDEQFDLVTRALGCTSDTARARLLDVDPKTIYRARRGVIGEEFIAKTLDVLTRHERHLTDLGIGASFESVFTLGEKPAAA